MKLVAIILNLPWTIIAIVFALLSIPSKVSFNKNPPALIIKIKSFWWWSWMPSVRGTRAMALGNVVLLGPLELPKDLEHELVHTEQFMREPFIHYFLHTLETWRHGYRQNKYEREAYDKAGNMYLEK